jgi:hypothetical protein
MMNQWLASQSQKKQVTEASMQRKRLGIKEAVNYGDIDTRVIPGKWATGKYPRSPESAANLARRLGDLANVAGGEDIVKAERAAKSLVAKGVGALPMPNPVSTTGVIDDVITAAKRGNDLVAGVIPDEMRVAANERQLFDSKTAQLSRAAKKTAEAERLKLQRNTIKTGGSKLPKALGVASAVLGLAAGANAADIAHGLNPLSVLDSGSLGTDDMMGEPIEFKKPAPKEQKPLPGAQYMYPAKMNENNMMNAWLQSQSQKQQPSTRSMEQKRQGIAITEQLNAEEEAVAKSHKSMLANMVKQYGKEKGTRVFYAKVRELAKKK